MVLMKQFILTASVSASLVFAQGTAPSPANPKSLPAPPSPQEVLSGRPARRAPYARRFTRHSCPHDRHGKKPQQRNLILTLRVCPKLRQQARGPLKRQMAEQIVRVKLLSQQAKKSGLAEDPAVKARLAFQTGKNLLAGAAYNDLLAKVRVDDASAQSITKSTKTNGEEVESCPSHSDQVQRIPGACS